MRRAVQRAVQKFALELQADKSLDKKERRRCMQEFRVKEYRRQKLALGGETGSSKAVEWRRKNFGDRDSRFIDPQKKKAKHEKIKDGLLIIYLAFTC